MGLFESLPVIGSMLDTSSGKGMDSLGDARSQFANLTLPELQWQNYSPDTINPEMAQSTQISDDPNIKSAQLAALAKMGDLANTGLSAVDQAGYENARELGNQVAQSGNQAAMQNASMRGLAGSGMEFANREAAQQAGAQRAQQAALQQASDSAKQRAMYNQAYGQQLGAQRSQDLGLNAQNAGILNQFNMANTQAGNAAQATNVGNKNQAQLINQQGRTGIAQQNFDNAYKKAGGTAAADSGMAQGYAAQNAANQAQANAYTNVGMQAMGYGGGAKKQNNADGSSGT